MSPQASPQLACHTPSFPIRNIRGAVLLLTVYLVSLTLLLLGSVGLQRTLTEMRAAALSRDMQQAFWLAESGLDHIMVRMRTEDLRDQQSPANGPCPLVTSSLLGTISSCEITTTGSEIVSSTTQSLIRQITVRGTTLSGRSVTLNATVSEDSPLKGIWSEGPIYVANWSGDPQPLQADVRTSLGTRDAVILAGPIAHQGRLQIADSQPTTNAYARYGNQTPIEGWAKPMGQVQADGNGVLLGPVVDGGQIPSLDSKLAIATMGLFPWTAAPYVSSQCQNNINLTTAVTQEIHDGDALDLSGPGDGKIVTCLQYLYAEAGPYPQARVIFRAPTTLYLTGPYKGQSASFEGTALYVRDLFAAEAGGASPDFAPLIPHGLNIIVTSGKDTVQPARTGRMELMTSRFAGSIYAPKSYVKMTGGLYEGSLDSLVTREVQMIYNSYPMNLAGGSNNNASSPKTVQLRRWAQSPPTSPSSP